MSKPERILEAALQVMADRGPHEVTVDEIAERAGVAKGTVYLYFRNKDSLLSAIMQLGLETFEASVRERVTAETHPVDELRALIEEHVLQLYEHVKLGRVMWSYASTVALPLEFKELFLLSVQRYVELVADILIRGQEAGCMNFLDAKLTARALIGSLNQAVFHFSEQDHICDVKIVVSAITDFILNGVTSPRVGGS